MDISMEERKKRVARELSPILGDGRAGQAAAVSG
jgi:hypothetical protein